jgi:kynureninase
LLEGRVSLQTEPPNGLEAALDRDVAVLLLTQVNFRDGSLHDIERLTRAAHDQGILVIWDLAHSAGAVPLHLDRWQVDFAVGCGYKFLNGGPGAPAFVYVNQRHLANVSQPVQGWMGHQAPFAFSPDYQPAEGITRFLTGTPPILSMAALDAALELFADVSMEALRDKSIQLSECFLALLAQHADLAGLQLLSPRQASRRGSQLAFAHPEAYGISRALADAGVLVDFRSPDVLRFGFAPLFLRFQDIQQAVEKLASIMATGQYRQARYQHRQKVT